MKYGVTIEYATRSGDLLMHIIRYGIDAQTHNASEPGASATGQTFDNQRRSFSK